uniref:Protein phosphatase n=1 Tax=Trichuris muris TaxID=70415 RepID=A0A5S6QRK8_TRIMR
MCLKRTTPTIGQIKRSVLNPWTLSRLVYNQLLDYTGVRRVQRFVAACCGFPKNLTNPSVRNSFGDDAYFIARHHTADVLGVADGVGGWRSYGVDPSRFARSLMSTCAYLVTKGQFIPQLPAELMAASYQALRNGYCSDQCLSRSQRRSAIVGSSTACIVVLDRSSSQLYAANLGDSGFLLMRNGRIVLRSKEQQHYFNAPFQLTVMPGRNAEKFIGDRPESADIRSFTLIEKEMARLDSFEPLAVQRVCNSIAYQARLLSSNSTFLSPFAKKAQLQGFNAVGGKPDDITVILAVVAAVEREASDSL